MPDLEEKIISDTPIDLFNDSFTILYSLKDSYDEKISTSICVDNRAIDFPILKNETIPENIKL